MSDMNGTGATPLEEAWRKLTTILEGPTCGVRLLVRRLGAHEVFHLTKDLPTAAMSYTEVQAYLEALPAPEREAYLAQSREIDRQILSLAVLSPRLSDAFPAPEGTLSALLLEPDRAWLIYKILEFSRLLPTPPAETPVPAPSEEVSGEAFRGAVAAPLADGGDIPPAPVAGDPPVAAGL